jgi:hypothetical protein
MGLTGVLAIVLILWLVMGVGSNTQSIFGEPLPHQPSKSLASGRVVLTPMGHALSVFSMRRRVL